MLLTKEGKFEEVGFASPSFYCCVEASGLRVEKIFVCNNNVLYLVLLINNDFTLTQWFISPYVISLYFQEILT